VLIVETAYDFTFMNFYFFLEFFFFSHNMNETIMIHNLGGMTEIELKRILATFGEIMACSAEHSHNMF
jgi:hypothetical protein